MKNNKYTDLLAKVDEMTIEEVKAAEEEIKEDYSKMVTLKKAAERDKKESKSFETKSFKGITSFRYGAMNLYGELGINHDTEYSKDDLIKILKDHGYFEFDNKNTDFAQHSVDGTIVITIRGNSKGLSTTISSTLLSTVENYFKDIYKDVKTEARVLIYVCEETKLFVPRFPKQNNTLISTTSDIQFNFVKEGQHYYLAFDFHSHHKMGAYFSRKDDDNERFRNIVFGVFSWYGNVDTWKFRTFDGNKFIDLKNKEVIKE